MNDRLWLSPPHMGGNELTYIEQAFRENWITTLGPNVDGLEKDICAFTGVKYAIALNSGTAAIHLGLILLNVGTGDEVICSSFTFSASANPIVYLGASPIFIDSEPETWNMSPIFLEEAIIDRIEKGKKPKAIILVHLYGQPAQMDKIMEVAEKYGIPVLEDAAESLGSTYKNRQTGTFGKVGIFSFNGNKIITTSGGGALITDDKGLADKARFLGSQARDPLPHYEHSSIGYNYRMSNVSAGIGRGQMEVLKEWINKRRFIFNYYKENLKNISAINFLPELNDTFSNRWLSCLVVNTSPAFIFSRDKLIKALDKENIESRPLWKPMHLQPIYKNCPYYGIDISESLFEKGLCLPSGSALTERDLDRVITVMKKHF